jgi:hypothetical protein
VDKKDYLVVAKKVEFIFILAVISGKPRQQVFLDVGQFINHVIIFLNWIVHMGGFWNKETKF